MKRANDIAELLLRICGCAALIAFVLALLSIAFATLQLRQDIDDVTNNFIGVAEHLSLLEGDLDDRVNEAKPIVARADIVLSHAVPVEDAALARVNDLQTAIASANAVEAAALDRVNELKAPAHQLNALVLDTRLSVDNINKAAIDERFYFEQQVPPTMSKLDAVIDGLLPVETNAMATLAGTASMAKHGDAVMGDVQFEADKIAHPAKKKLGFWGTVYAGAKAAHQFEPPLF